MAPVTKEFEHLKIHLEELKLATNNFSSKIGAGGFGNVYEGVVTHSNGRSMVAIKRLSRKSMQGEPEFWKEIMMLSRYRHKNLISLLGYCNEANEKILVYEHASKGSLDRHLSSNVLTWTQRLKICLDVARGLAYLHDHKGTQQRVLHRDIKSANILLDDNWNAKLSDMGLSKIGLANQRHTVLFTNLAGTPGYCDPQYMFTYALTKESDIYSFGVVLFEVLCGRLCFNNHPNGHFEILVPMWKQSYKRKKLGQIIFKDLTPPMDPTSLETFSTIAFQCLHDSRDQRPTMSLLMQKLETALKFQERHDMRLANAMGTSETNRYVDELNVLRTKGKELFLSGGKTKTEEAKQNLKLIHFDNDSLDYTLEDILKGSAEVMGKSSYGTHYKVTMKNGYQFAVNRLGEYPTGYQIEIEGKLIYVGNIRHVNLMPLRAFHLNQQQILLIYYCMPKGNIAAFLHGGLDVYPHYGRPKTQIDHWPTRMQIVKGVARGLLSLHTYYNRIHGNLTSHNVWLDHNFTPKISDFGLSFSNKIANASFREYKAPELMSDDLVNTKTDVYSLGMIMLELLTGKSPEEPTNGLSLPRWVALTTEKNDGRNEVFDHELMKNSSAVIFDELFNSLRLALDCIRQSPQDRPDVQVLCQRLEEIRPETIDDDGSVGPSSC